MPKRLSPKVAVIMAALALTSSPAASAQKLGARTQPPEQVLAQIGDGSSDAELERAVLAASAFPLGSLQNPIRVGGPDGQRVYLARLKCSDGSRPSIGTGESAGVGGFGSIVERFQLDCRSAAPGKVQIVIDKYHAEHRETRVPAEFAVGSR